MSDTPQVVACCPARVWHTTIHGITIGDIDRCANLCARPTRHRGRHACAIDLDNHQETQP